jgi:MFS family permease
MMVNSMGSYVTIFLVVILTVRHIPARDISVALLTAAVFAIAGSGLGGFLVSKLGSRWTIFLCGMGSAVFTALFIPRLPFLAMVADICLITLFTRAFIPAASTLVGRLSAPGERLQRYATLQLGMNIGYSLGPPLAAFLVTRSLTALLLIDAVTSGCLAAAALRLPDEAEIRASETRLEQVAGPAADSIVARRVRDDRRYLGFCVAVAMILIAYFQISGALPLAVRAHHYSLELLGLFFSANSVAVILFQLPLTFVTRRFRPSVSLTVGGFLICASYVLFTIGVNVPIMVCYVAIWTIGEMIYNPIIPYIAMAMSTPSTRGSYQGAVNVARSVGQMVGPAIGVFAYSISTWLPWAGCAVLAVAVAALGWTSIRSLPSANALAG